VTKSKDPTIGFLELKGAVHGLDALDTVVKAAPIEVLRTNIVCPNKFTVLFGGELAAVSAALAAARSKVGQGIYDSCLIGRVHPLLRDGLYGIFPRQKPGTNGALGILETLTIAAGLCAADEALKTAEVVLVDLRLGYALGGRTYFLVSGAISAVEAAMGAALQVVIDRGALGSHSLIPRPSDGLRRMMDFSGGDIGDCT